MILSNYKDYSFKRFNRLYFPVAIILLLMTGASYLVGADFNVFKKGIKNGAEFVTFMFPPEWSSFPEMIQPAFESMLLAFLSTIFGTIMSIFFALAAAGNISHKWLRNASRFLISTERSLPEIVILLILIAGFGLGPFPGVIALSLGCIGMLGKLFADAIEEIDPIILESLQAVGANKAQIVLFGVIPVIFHAIVTNAIFRFEINIRMSIVLGAVGAGGIGFELYNSFALLEYKRASVSILVILAMVFVTERLSDFVRKRLGRHEVLK